MEGRKKIICYGELLLDCYGSIKEGFVPKFGGAPGNTAIGLSQLGVSGTAFVGKVGSDFFGDFLERTLKSHNIDTKYLFRSKESPTTLAFVSLGPKGERDFSFHLGAHEKIELNDVKRVKFNGFSIMQLGSLTQMNKANFQATDYMLKNARRKKIFISYDPNIRLPLWPNKSILKKTILNTVPQIDLLKISEEELKFLAGTNDIKKGVAKLWKKNLQLLIVTLGGKGAYWKNAGGEGFISGKKVKAIDTTGAGDAFNAGILSLLSKYINSGELRITEDDLKKAISFANKVAALSTLKKGAIEAMPTLEETDKF